MKRNWQLDTINLWSSFATKLSPSPLRLKIQAISSSSEMTIAVAPSLVKFVRSSIIFDSCAIPANGNGCTTTSFGCESTNKDRLFTMLLVCNVSSVVRYFTVGRFNESIVSNDRTYHRSRTRNL